MRDIKFRIWETFNNKMTEWDELQNAQISILNRPESIVKDEFVVMQYTGLKDKNGKEIYEFDLVKTHDPRVGKMGLPMASFNCIVVWWDGAFLLNHVGLDDPTLFEKIPPKEWLEVIGNIYENEELLKTFATIEPDYL